MAKIELIKLPEIFSERIKHIIKYEAKGKYESILNKLYHTNLSPYENPFAIEFRGTYKHSLIRILYVDLEENQSAYLHTCYNDSGASKLGCYMCFYDHKPFEFVQNALYRNIICLPVC